MPIYMDRHDLDETVNAEHVAHIHQEDLKIEHEFGCKGLTYWFDEERKTAFCLINAPNKEALTEMHNKAHGAIPNSIIEVDPSIVESFLGRIEDPVKAKEADLNIISEGAFRVLMITEIGFCNLRCGHKHKEYVDLFHLQIKQLTKKFNGSIVQEKLNKALISFRSVSEALACSSEFQDSFRSHGTRSIDFVLKVGVSAGVPIAKGETIFEEVISLAERLCHHVDGEIILSSEAKELYHKEHMNLPIDERLLRSLEPSDEKFLNLFMEYLESSWQRSDLQVNDFSSFLGLSKSQLYRKVKFLTGKSLNIFLKEYRLNRALRLIDRKKGNISEIAFDTGFNSPAYFSKCFYQTYGMLPSKYMNLS